MARAKKNKKRKPHALSNPSPRLTVSVHVSPIPKKYSSMVSSHVFEFGTCKVVEIAALSRSSERQNVPPGT